MTSTTIITLPSPSFCPSSSVAKFSDPKNPPPQFLHFHHRLKKKAFWMLKVTNCVEMNPESSSSTLARFDLQPRDLQNSSISASGLLSLRLRRLASEFQSLLEPIDRVRRLLEYAMVLPRLGESARSPENRVAGCAAQVWLEVEMDELGRIRFGAESDSEITKGFCSCLIYLLDGASPEEVLQVKGEDLADMNVGLPVRSRVNSWHNVLVAMQDRTKALVAEREENHSLESFPSMIISPESNIITKDGIRVPGMVILEE
ncbi:hypothetical protein Dimus_015157 [Dionaea muscipula]